MGSKFDYRDVKTLDRLATENKCHCDCGCTKQDDDMSGSPLQCDDCDNGTHWDEKKCTYVDYNTGEESA